jgi:HTH-type transcriptional regulator, transcriptional repressor of NAD biosynthesis genes
VHTKSVKERAKTGMILGKFLPPHRGHIHLIEHALSRVERLTIVVGTLSHESIDGRLRFTWMRELFPTARVVHLAQELPQDPTEHPDFWGLWTRALRGVLPEAPELVFSSEDYGDKLAECLGARHILVDKPRQSVPISGTKIRIDPYQNWHFLPACVRAYFARRVVLFGTESTGKTTLARQLSEHFQTEYVPEYARAFIEQKPAGWSLSQLNEADFAQLVYGQIIAEEEAARRANQLLFCDTDPLASTVWARRYLGACPAWLTALAHQRTYDLYLLTDPQYTCWEADSTRDSQHLQVQIHQELQSALHQKGARVVTLSGPLEIRLAQAIDSIMLRLKHLSS